MNVHDGSGGIGDGEPGALEAVSNGGRSELGDCFAAELPGKIGKAVAGYGGANFAEIDFDQIRRAGISARESRNCNRRAGETDEAADFLEAACSIELHGGSIFVR